MHGVPSDTSEAVRRSRRVANPLVRWLDLYGWCSNSVESYLDALTFNVSEDGCTFAPTEVSLSFCRDRAPGVRCLGEVVNVCVPDSPELTVAKLGDHLIGALADRGGTYDLELFRDLTKIAYSKHRDVRRALRFGAAVEWPNHPSSGLKCYFDLHSDGREFAANRMAAAFQRLGLQPQFARARELLGSRFEQGRCRGMATDLDMSGIRGIRLYTPGARWTLKELRELLAATGRRDQIDLLELFNASVLGGLTSRDTVSHLLVSLVFTSATGSEPILKLDAFMPALKPDDLASYQAFSSLAENLEIPTEQYAEAFRVVSDPEDLSHTQRILQYLSVDFLPAPHAKLNSYFRLPGTESEHMERRVQPRRKPRMLSLLDEACRRAIQALERERLTQYSEAVHRMVFPRAAGFSSEQELHLGGVFQRALIIDALLDAKRAGYLIDHEGLDDDVARLVDMRSPEGLRGWKYFPSLAELPPDADDLAQVMQALWRVEYANLDELVDPLLRVIEESSKNEDGWFETWIVNSDDESPASALVKKFINTHWGTGPDPEVIANMLYAMWIYDSGRYQSCIHGAIGYLASCQLPNGSWPAAWYAGSYYPTFVCVRAFRAADHSHYALYRATQFLVEMQQVPGGWGTGAPNSGDSAYALRAVCLLDNEMARQMVIPGCQFLFQQQQTDGFWPASDFIKMDTSRAASPAGERVLVYRSRTITTAACLSALCAARPLVEVE